MKVSSHPASVHLDPIGSRLLRGRVSGLALCGALLAGALAPAAPAQALDFLVTKFEVNQCVQTGNTPLVAGRTTFVRAGVRVVNPTGPTNPVDGLLRIFVDGVESPDSPVFSDNGPFPATLPINFAIEDGSLNFIFLAPLSDNVVLQVEVNPAGPNFVAEGNTANNTFTTAQLVFGYQRAPELAYVPIDYRPTGGSIPNLPNLAQIEPGMGDNFVQGIYPAPDWYYHRTDVPSKIWEQSLAGTGSGLLSALQVDINLMVPQPDFLYGFVPGGLSYNGQSFINGNVSMGNTELIRYQRTIAHELGHNFGLQHNTLTTGLIGVDVEHHLKLTQNLPQIKDASLKDIMYAGLLTQEAWVAAANYNFFYNHFVFNPQDALTAAGGNGPVLLVAGLWNSATGAVELTDVLALPTGRLTQPVAASGADVVVRAFSGGTLVQEIPIAARTSADECAACGGGEDADSNQDVSPLVPFAAVLPASTAIDQLVIAQAGVRPLSTVQLTRSAAAPEAAFTSPAAGLLDASVLQVVWTAGDADGDAVNVHLRYSPDGSRFVPLASSTGAGSADVDLGSLPAFVNGQGFFELLASDGLNTTRVRSAPLSRSTSYAGTAGSAPWVQLVTPDDGTTFLRGGTVVLHSSGWDIEDRGLDGDSIEWSSSVDGFLGTGRLFATRLSAGVHVLTVQATDSTGQTATDSATVTVNDRDLPTTSSTVCQQDLGFGGPGTSVLSLCGDELGTGGSADLALTGAPAFAPAFLVAGFVNGPIAFKGGQLLPNPWTLIITMATDGSGELTIPGIAGGGGPFTAYVQAVVVDAAQPQGFGLSNAVQADFLP